MSKSTIGLILTAIVSMVAGVAAGWVLRGPSGVSNSVATGSTDSAAIVQQTATFAGSAGIDPASSVVAGYAAAATCNDRLAFITNPDGDRAALFEHNKQNCQPWKPESIDTSGCKSPKDDGYCYPVIVVSKGKNAFGAEAVDSVTWCMEQTPNGFKIDWRCSIGYNPITVPAFRAQHTIKQPAIFRVHAKLADYYNYEYRNAGETHYSIHLHDKEDEQIYAYVLRKSPEGQKLFDRLKDGKEHAVLIEIVYLPKSETSSIAAVNRLLGFGWREEPAEYLAAAR